MNPTFGGFRGLADTSSDDASGEAPDPVVFQERDAEEEEMVMEAIEAPGNSSTPFSLSSIATRSKARRDREDPPDFPASSRIRPMDLMDTPVLPSPGKFTTPPLPSRSRGQSVKKGKKKTGLSPSPSFPPGSSPPFHVAQLADLRDKVPAVPFDVIDQAAEYARRLTKV